MDQGHRYSHVAVVTVVFGMALAIPGFAPASAACFEGLGRFEDGAYGSAFRWTAAEDMVESGDLPGGGFAGGPTGMPAR